MLMRRATAYSSSCSQVILVYLHPFCRRTLLAAKNRQTITKTPYFWGFKINQGHQCWQS